MKCCFVLIINIIAYIFLLLTVDYRTFPEKKFTRWCNKLCIAYTNYAKHTTMKHRINSLLLVIVLVLGINRVHAQEASSILWEISGKGLAKPSYLYGTIHLMCPEDFEIKEKTKRAFEKSSKLVLELNFADTAELRSLQRFAVGEKKLSEQLNSEQLHKLELILKENKMTLAQVDQLSGMTLMSLLIAKSLPCQQQKYYEFEFMRMAKQAGHSIGGLETVAEQMGAANKSFSLTDIIDQYGDIAEYRAFFSKMVAAYKAESYVALGELVRDRRYMNDQAERVMLTDRNHNWIVRMPAMMQQESVFFAVGAGHLGGTEGVINLLKKEGYTVKPVNQ